MRATDDPIVAFYEGRPDDRGRTLHEILHWSDEDLERVHDYIQWVFPTRRRSGVNPFAPLVTDSTAAAFAARAELRDRLLAAFERMLAFCGLRRVIGDRGVSQIEIDGTRFDDRARVWLRPGNHNHLRLTRMMESLSALGLRAEARALQQCLTQDVYEGPGRNRITRETYEFWMQAVAD